MKAMSITLAACLMICVSTLINSLCSSKIGCMCVEFLVDLFRNVWLLMLHFLLEHFIFTSC
ncbi:hypothetical protein HanRHA438_Chr17g0839941 [Helianthus annuus]|nr:hypothetical protein HanHA89_Chr17g0728711 [Helianthus annuus]KAJ0634318.1 hypothetical protein HanLR1_Chr17g0686741 [Helianthus annuus]KAJ0828683.1 hypothetical protein HanRHA438_Chr17g0839941 [Helianthus annuus]